jgi:hypothetical protein
MENQLEFNNCSKTKSPFNVNIQNMKNVQYEIERKKYNERPYYATQKNVVQVVTDYDELPYKRWYRGFPESEVPIIAEREAGYRPLIRQIYLEEKSEPEKINHCFESACSVVYPCYPEYLKKYSDADKMNVMLNKSCLNKRL